MEIPLTQGRTATIDDEDWPLVAPYQWFAVRKDGLWYALATPLNGGRNSAKVKMHQIIFGSKSADHRDGNGLNNRRANLRHSTNALNQQNTAARGGASQYKGVS